MPSSDLLLQETTTLSEQLAEGSRPGLHALAYRLLYARADAVVCCSEAMLEDLVRRFGLPRQRLRCVPNPVDEDAIERIDALEVELAGKLNRPNVLTAALCGKLEMELAQMDAEDEAEFRESLGAGEPGLDRMVRLSYDLLGLISFLTTGPDETRAWTIRKGMSAVEAAGKIHSDIQRGFIRAEIVGYEGRLTFDTTKPDGTPRKLLDVSRLKALGWTARIGLREGIESTYAWFRSNVA